MYRPLDEIETESLRQGDLIADIHILGAINPGGIQYITPAQGQNHTGWFVNTRPIYGDAVVLSHSCEIAAENKIKTTGIILAPIRDVESATDAKKVEELIESNLVEEKTEASYLKYFYLEPHEKLPHRRGSVVDFSKCFSVRKNYYGNLLDRKKLQMQPDIAQSLALKLALYFHREQETK